MPHGSLTSYLQKHFCQILTDSTSDVVVEQSSVPLIKNYEVLKVNSQILQFQKVRNNRHIEEGDKRVHNIQEFSISATYP